MGSTSPRLASSVVVDQVYVAGLLAIKLEDNTPVFIHFDRPEPTVGACQGMQAPAGLVHICGLRADVQQGEDGANSLHPLGVLMMPIFPILKNRSNPLCVKLLIMPGH